MNFPIKPTFYEQVTEVKVRYLSFLHWVFAFVVGWLRRMLFSTEFLFALLKSFLSRSSVPVGVQYESRCCQFTDGLFEGQSRHAVIGTRGRRNR